MSTLIKGARLIDGTGAAPLERGMVLIEGEEIVGIGPEGEIACPPEAEAIVASGWTVAGATTLSPAAQLPTT